MTLNINICSSFFISTSQVSFFIINHLYIIYHFPRLESPLLNKNILFFAAFLFRDQSIKIASQDCEHDESKEF